MGLSYDAIIKQKEKDWKCDDLIDGYKNVSGKKLPFSSPLLNYSLYGGIPRAAITEFLGQPSGGKSTSAIDICQNAYQIFKKEYDDEMDKLRTKSATGDKKAQLQLSDLEERGIKKVLYIDLEHSFDAAWSKKLGIKDGEVDVMQPPNVFAEDVLQTVQELVETGEMGLIVLDSIPSLITHQEMDKAFGERTVASLAGLMTIFCRKIVPLLSQYDCTLIMINQTRVNMDNPYAVQSPGGEAIKFYASLRLLFKIGHPVDFLGQELPMSAENPAGYIVTMKVIKQKSAPNDRRAGSYYLMTQSGIRTDIDLVQLAIKKYGCIKKGGAWFTLCDPTTGEILSDDEGKPVKICGLPKVYDWVQTHPDYLHALEDYTLADIKGQDEHPEENYEDE